MSGAIPFVNNGTLDWMANGSHAHPGEAECSGVGTCDRIRGVCHCPVGWTGAACDRRECPTRVPGSHPNIAMLAVNKDPSPRAGVFGSRSMFVHEGAYHHL